MAWINVFFDKVLMSPFIIEKDNDYRADLSKKYSLLIKTAKESGADADSLRILSSSTEAVKKALLEYYKGNVVSAYQKIQNLVKKCVDEDKDQIALCGVNDSIVFPYGRTVDGSVPELQLFRARAEEEMTTLKAKDMLHLPFKLRNKTGNYRFSIPGVPSLYLANSSYGCWIELGKPSEHNFNVSPVLLDGEQKVFNLAVSLADNRVLRENFVGIDNLDAVNTRRVHTWLRQIVLMIATSYRVKEDGRRFKSEYIISQAIMLACKRIKSVKIDGVAYFSKRVENELFARTAINLALFTPYRKNKEYAELCEHLKVGDPFNFMMFKQLNAAGRYSYYQMRYEADPLISNINEGNFRRQYSFRDTAFCDFDKFMFYKWKQEGKDTIEFGNAIEE